MPLDKCLDLMEIASRFNQMKFPDGEFCFENNLVRIKINKSAVG